MTSPMRNDRQRLGAEPRLMTLMAFSARARHLCVEQGNGASFKSIYSHILVDIAAANASQCFSKNSSQRCSRRAKLSVASVPTASSYRDGEPLIWRLHTAPANVAD